MNTFNKLILFTFLILFSFKSYTVENSEATTTSSGAGTAEKSNVESNKMPSEFPKNIKNICSGLQSKYSENVKDACIKVVSPKATTCNDDYVPAGTACNPDTNSNLLQQTALIQGLLSTAQGLTDSCSTFSKAMDIGKLAMSAYSAYCGAKRQICENACSNSIEMMKKLSDDAKMLIKNIESVHCPLPRPSPETDIACPPALDNDTNVLKNIIKEIALEDQTSPTTIGGKLKSCKIDMMTLIGMGLANIGALAQSKAMSDQCNKETKANTASTAVDCTKEENKTKTECASTTVVDCGLAANADKPICICKANPRITGCEGISTSLATNSNMSTGGSGGTSGRGAKGTLTTSPNAAENKQFPADLSKTSKNDGSGSGGFGSGSTAGLTAGSDSSNADPSQLAKNESAGNANILSTESGGGSGYRFGFGSSSSGSKFPARGLAAAGNIKGKIGAQDWTAQVTSNGGKSNFEKVKVRYNENRTSLLNR